MPIQLSGSLVITGSITTTGVITMSGSIASASYSSTSDLLQGTGSVGFTTTASFNAVSSSQQQISSSYIALSASYNTFSGSASTRITVDSASLLQVSSSQQQISASLLNVISIFATTGSNSFRANQSITGSLVVSSTITAQTLVVQTVTSSIVYSSGSNIFGCDLNSRQTFTGSVLITGSLTIAGASSATSYSAPTIYGSTAVCSAVGKFTTCLDLGGALTGTSATFSGIVAINGATNSGGLSVKTVSSVGLNIQGTAASSLMTFTPVSYDEYRIGAGDVNVNDFGIRNATRAVTYLSFSGGASGGASIFSSTITGTTIYGSTAVCSPVGYFSGCVGVGFTGYGGSKLTLVASTNPTCASSANMQLSMGEASQNTTYSFKLGYIYVGGGYIGAIQTIAGGVASTTVINPDGGNVGIGTSSPQSSYKVTISGTDTVYPAIYLDNTTNGQAYSIRATGTNFSIRDNSSGNDRITLTCVGKVGIGTSSPPSTLSVQWDKSAAFSGLGVYDSQAYNASNHGGTITFGGIYNSGGSYTEWAAIGGMKANTTNDDYAGNLTFYIRPSSSGMTEIMRIGCYGSSSHNFIMVGRTNAGLSAGIGITLNATTGQIESSVNGDDILNLNRNVSDGKIIRLFKNCAEVGSISTNTYSLPSDINFKTNINNLDLGLNFVNKLRPVSYNHKVDDSGSALSTGFIAQEMQCTLDELGVERNSYFILQHKPVEDQNESQYWLDYTKMIPILTKAIQEQQCTINTLKTCIGIA